MPQPSPLRFRLLHLAILAALAAAAWPTARPAAAAEPSGEPAPATAPEAVHEEAVHEEAVHREAPAAPGETSDDASDDATATRLGDLEALRAWVDSQGRLGSPPAAGRSLEPAPAPATAPRRQRDLAGTSESSVVRSDGTRVRLLGLRGLNLAVARVQPDGTVRLECTGAGADR